jgi:hypothetical protein
MKQKKEKYWKIAPGSGGSAWVEQRDNNCIAIGWGETGDLNKYKTESRIRRKFSEVFHGEKTRPTQLLKFYREIHEHDKILANSGREIYGVGRVTGRYKYDDGLYYEHSRPVRWESTYWEPLNVESLGLPGDLTRRIRLNRTVLELEPGEWVSLDEALNRVKNPFQGMNNFEGVCRAPQTEQEAIILFGKLSQHLKMRIEYVGKPFPDAFIRVKKGSRWITKAAEFELNSSDFERHGHLKSMEKGKECDMIICWKDDWTEKPRELEVVEIRKELEEIV